MMDSSENLCLPFFIYNIKNEKFHSTQAHCFYKKQYNYAKAHFFNEEIRYERYFKSRYSTKVLMHLYFDVHTYNGILYNII